MLTHDPQKNGKIVNDPFDLSTNYARRTRLPYLLKSIKAAEGRADCLFDHRTVTVETH